LARDKVCRTGCELRRSPGLAVNRLSSESRCGPSRYAAHQSAWRTMRGSGRRRMNPPYSRASATACVAPVFPSTKFAVIVGGRARCWFRIDSAP